MSSINEKHHHEHEHKEHLACGVLERRISKTDRLIILMLSLVFSLIFLKPFISYQSLMRGYAYTELGEASKAVKHLKRSISLNNKNDQAWSLLAYNLQKLGEIKESIEAYKMALKLNPKDSQAAIEYALILYKEKKYAEAANILKNHLEKSSEFLGGWLLLAKCYEKTGDMKGAISIYRLIYEKIDPGNEIAKQKLGQYNNL